MSSPFIASINTNRCSMRSTRSWSRPGGQIPAEPSDPGSSGERLLANLLRVSGALFAGVVYQKRGQSPMVGSMQRLRDLANIIDAGAPTSDEAIEFLVCLVAAQNGVSPEVARAALRDGYGMRTKKIEIEHPPKNEAFF